MTKEQKKQLRADLFCHLDGIVTAPTAFALHKKGVLDFLLKTKKTSLKELTKSSANANYGENRVGDIPHSLANISKAKEYTYIFPAIATSIQAGGRCIRDDSDRGLIFLLDGRFYQNKELK